jgi:hypothetical protein
MRGVGAADGIIANYCCGWRKSFAVVYRHCYTEPLPAAWGSQDERSQTETPVVQIPI